MTDLAKVGVSISYMPRFAFCRDCARLGRKKYRSEARMIFPSNQSGGPPCPIEGKRRPLQVRIEIRYEWRSAMEKKNRPVDRRGADSVERFHPVGFQQCQDIFLLVQ